MLNPDLIKMVNGLTCQEISELFKYCKTVYTEKGKVEKRNKINDFNLGDIVKFDAGKKGYKQGTIIEKKISNIIILVGMTTWKVSANIVEKV